MKKWFIAVLLVQLLVMAWWFTSQHRMLKSVSGGRRATDLQKGERKVIDFGSLKDLEERMEVKETSVKGVTKVKKNVESAEKGGVTEHYERESILIALASYGDMECAPTVARAYERAAYPDRVFFGIFQQHNCSGLDDAASCKDCIANIHNQLDCPNHPLCTRLWQVRVSRLPMRQTQGVTFGRHMAENHYQGETYVMNIDSHSHFSRGWDSEIIDMFKRIDDDHAIITTYPSHYTERHTGFDKSGDGEFEISRSSHEMCICTTNKVKIYKSQNFKHVVGHMHRPSKPIRTAFLAAGFNFAKGHRVANVPYDPYTPFLFDGEEMSFAVRAWTHGYDFYHPDKSVVAHLYITSGSKLRPVFWTDKWNERYVIQWKSTLRVNYILGLHDIFDKVVPESEIDLREIQKYGLGTARTTDQYWTWAGIDLQGDEKSSKSLCGIYQSGGMPPVPRKGIDI